MVNVDDEGVVGMNAETISHWLSHQGIDGAALPASSTKPWFDAARQALDRRLLEVSNTDLHPENREWAAAAWRGEGSAG